jgi:hypothetical protein
VDGDDPEDLIGVWNTGLWVRKSSSGAWTKLSANLPTDIAAGDMNGDGRDDVVGTWASGVWYRNSISGGWVLMSSSAASKVAAGAIDGDGKNDLIGVWDTGLWVKKSATGAWIKLSSALPKDIDAGLFRTGATAYAAGLTEQDLIAAETPGSSGYFEDLSNEGPGGWKFEYDQEDNLVPFELEPKLALGPGDPGFHFESQENLVPREGMGTHKDKEKPAIDKRD